MNLTKTDSAKIQTQSINNKKESSHLTSLRDFCDKASVNWKDQEKTSICATKQLAPLVHEPTIEEKQSARIIIQAVRKYYAKKAYARMQEGTNWGDQKTDEKSIIKLSRQNIKRLISELKPVPLSEAELKFINRFMKLSFFATHATSADIKNDKGTAIVIYSRQELLAREELFDTEHTTENDITERAHDGFVFFSYEVGKTPKKPSSRFGDSLYKFNLDKQIFKDVAWITLTDMVNILLPNAEKHIPGLLKSDYRNLSRSRDLQTPEEHIFHGNDIKLGIVFNIIKDLRECLSVESREKVLSASTDDEFNRLINGLYRPELKIPRYFFATTDETIQTQIEHHYLGL